LKRLNIDNEIVFINPLFNSVLIQRLNNRVEFEFTIIPNINHLIFLYLNFNLQSYQLYDRILSLE
jgi:hypothetical protein